MGLHVRDNGQKSDAATKRRKPLYDNRRRRADARDGGGCDDERHWRASADPADEELVRLDIRYWKQLQGPQSATMSAEQMAAVLAMFPLVGKAMDRMQKDGDKLAGTALDSTVTFEAVKSPEQLAQAQEQQKSSGGGGLGGLLAKKIMKTERRRARSTSSRLATISSRSRPRDAAASLSGTIKRRSSHCSSLRADCFRGPRVTPFAASKS